jgi:sodium/proline symporter
MARPRWQAATDTLPAGFFSLTGDLTPLQAGLMFFGFSGLAVAFNLGQPHMVNRWLSARSATTVKQSRWIYLISSQILFLGFTALGAFIRLVVESPDPEQALVAFVQAYAFPGAMGILALGAVSTIASTASAIVAVCADTLRFDVLDRAPSTRNKQIAVLVVGAGSLLALLFSDGSVFNMAITAVSLLGATLAGPVLFFIFGQRFTATGLAAGLIAGLGAGIAWVALGLSNTLNESLPGLLAGLITLYAFRPRP